MKNNRRMCRNCGHLWSFSSDTAAKTDVNKCNNCGSNMSFDVTDIKPTIRPYRAWVLIEGKNPEIYPCFAALRAEVECKDLVERQGMKVTWTEKWSEVFKFAEKHNLLNNNHSYELSPLAKQLLKQ